MHNHLIYLLEVSLIFVLLYSIFRFMLSKYTFHNLNRFVLLMIIPISMSIPFIKSIYSFEVIPSNIPAFNEMHSETFSTNSTNYITHFSEFNYIKLLSIFYAIGILISFYKTLKAIFHLYKLRKNAIVKHANKYQLIYCETKETFSFFNWIFIPFESTHQSEKIIIDHEKQHANFHHTLDRLVTEIFIAFFWFNPVVYLFRKTLSAVHEYQVDARVLKDKNISTTEYLQLLLYTINNSYNKNLYSYFNQSMIKNRVEMICKSKTNNLLRFKYLILIPICFVCLLSFTKREFSVTKTLETNIATDKTSKNNSFIYPLKGSPKPYITSHFGINRKLFKKLKAKIHNGIDFKAKVNTPIFASSDGVVTSASFEGNWGNLIIIKHANGYETLYAHLNKFKCKKNQFVKKGEIIGYTGKTGLIKGPHLHYAIKHNGIYVNPINYLE
ncbi:peptidoglycan DD-metalloendopeptidase family protein [Tenacibaculum jejuense]|uniref:Membrane protein related to metalloendopeptidases n=1 Tax=Tenacibaculum jejuense TaxID=584609 RepID=A0A238UBS5_9FLAO|nr:peptidoglycan DD-metalloendopeptidase family protein [Tenacibaculum jejuense]SNR16436.1 Membrane protein related to metalloendopeptidases [Tenacibaculum jejuense]